LALTPPALPKRLSEPRRFEDRTHREAGLSFLPQHTLASTTTFSGVGIHGGYPVTVEVRPAAVGAGIVFLRTDETARDPIVPARADSVIDTRLGTTIGNADGVKVATVEHLMAALAGLEIDNAVVAIDGPEAPIMDGSSAPFVRALEAAGRRPQGSRRDYIEVLETIEVTDGDKYARLVPADGFEMAFEIAFDDAAIGRQSLDLRLDRAAFRRELADCRTFGFRGEVDALRAAGLARGGSLDNVVVIDGGAVLNAEGLRRPDEFVRHKMLDALGDLYLLGAPILGRYEARYSGHALNNALARAVLARPRAWRLADGPRELARAV
jgi:UDP-3-O-[3-hydroxymyristoyl] N-acetylglucosamine deacetylase